MKNIKLVSNNVGGVDLIVERDKGNEVRILTGKTKNSLDFWKRMKTKAIDAINEMEE